MIKRLNRYTLAIVLMVILVPSFIAVSLLNYFVQRDSIREELIHTSLPLVRDLIDWEIGTRLQEPLLASSIMAKDTFLIEWIQDGEQDPYRIERYLDSIRLEHGFASAFFVSSTTMLYYTYQGINKEITEEDAHDVWYYDFIKSEQKVALDVDTDEVSADKLTIFINCRVESASGEFLGVVGVGVDMSDIAALLQKTQQTYGRVVYMVDASALVQAHSDVSVIEKKNIRTSKGIDKIADTILSSKDHTLNTQYEGEYGNILLTSRYIPNIKWYIIVEQDERISLRQVRMMLLRTILIGLLASILVLFISIRVVSKYNAKLKDSTRLDHLTQGNNRLELDHRLLVEFTQSRRNGGTFSVLMIDLDNFKEVNDTFGHFAGDDTLIRFTRLVLASIRETDSFGRWGGDEFLLILPKTQCSDASIMANEIRLSVANSDVTKEFPVTVSIGVAELTERDTIESLISRADKALYMAKNAGKDQVCSL